MRLCQPCFVCAQQPIRLNKLLCPLKVLDKGPCTFSENLAITETARAVRFPVHEGGLRINGTATYLFSGGCRNRCDPTAAITRTSVTLTFVLLSRALSLDANSRQTLGRSYINFYIDEWMLILRSGRSEVVYLHADPLR